jgi:hypothetical protein
MLEPHNVIVRVADDYNISSRFSIPPLPAPQVEYIVQVNIGKQWAYTSALNCPQLALYSFAFIQYTGSQPFLDESYNSPIRDAMLNEFYQPFVYEGIKE